MQDFMQDFMQLAFSMSEHLAFSVGELYLEHAFVISLMSPYYSHAHATHLPDGVSSTHHLNEQLVV